MEDHIIMVRLRKGLAPPSLVDLARSLGHSVLTAEEAFEFFRERELILRRVQAELETHRSNAATALDALLDRIAQLKGGGGVSPATAPRSQNDIGFDDLIADGGLPEAQDRRNTLFVGAVSKEEKEG